MYLSLVFILLISFAGAMLESASLQNVKNYRRADMTRAVESIFAEYQKELWEVYGIFALEGSYETGSYSEELLKERLAYYGASGMDQEITRIQLLTDQGASAFYEQVTAYMENKYGIVGVAHVGLPTNDLQKTVEFYKSLGFEVIMQSYNEKAGEKVAFLQIKNYCIETFENRQAAMSDGAYQHVALDVEDIESMYQKICNEKYTVITDGIEELPFWENGVKFFMIKGPNEERIEFCQKL